MCAQHSKYENQQVQISNSTTVECIVDRQESSKWASAAEVNRSIEKRILIRFTAFTRRRKSEKRTSFQVPEFDAQPHADRSTATADEQDECPEECLRWAVHLEEVQPDSKTEEVWKLQKFPGYRV